MTDARYLPTAAGESAGDGIDRLDQMERRDALRLIAAMGAAAAI